MTDYIYTLLYLVGLCMVYIGSWVFF